MVQSRSREMIRRLEKGHLSSTQWEGQLPVSLLRKLRFFQSHNIIHKRKMCAFYNHFGYSSPFFFPFSSFPLTLPFQSQFCHPFLQSEVLLKPASSNDQLSTSPNLDFSPRNQPQVEDPVLASRKCKRVQENLEGLGGDQNFSERNQNKDRNLLSYILKGYVTLIMESRELVELVKRTSNSLKIKNGVSQFMTYIRRKFPPKRTYVGLRYVRQLVRQAATDPMALILAITLKHYLHETYTLIILHKQQVTKKVRTKCLRKAKELCSLLFFK